MTLRLKMSSKVYPLLVSNEVSRHQQLASLTVIVLLDREKVNQPQDWQKVQTEIRNIQADPQSLTVTKRLLIQIMPLPRSLASLVVKFTGSIHPFVPDFNILWGLVALNIKARTIRVLIHFTLLRDESWQLAPQRSSLRRWAG
jgi:hypothetical protein